MKMELLPWVFSVCQLREAAGIALTPYTFLSRTVEEISLVCPREQAPRDCIAREEGWRCFRIAGVLDFSLVGVLADVSGCLAAAGIPVFVLSTYNTDYVLVKEERLAEAVAALERAGHEIGMK